MTSNFDARKPSRQDAAKEMDSLQRDRFELLSAYIDGEVTASERRQVQELLATNTEMQHLYARLMHLRQGFQKIPVPPAQAKPDQVAQQVFARIDRRRTRKTLIWGGTAIAALFVSAVSGILAENRSWVPQFAQAPQQQVAPEPLMIALNRPIIEIPKAAVASPTQLVEPSAGYRSVDQNNLH